MRKVLLLVFLSACAADELGDLDDAGADARGTKPLGELQVALNAVGSETCDPVHDPCGCGPDPIIVDTLGDGVHLTDAANGIYFALRGPDVGPELVSWTQWNTDDAFLVMDRNANGKIDDGTEMFGNYSWQPIPPAAGPNGYLSLAIFDLNHDGLINSSDAVWQYLRLWQDTNHNGINESWETHTLAEFGIANLTVTPWATGTPGARDANGNRQAYASFYSGTGCVPGSSPKIGPPTCGQYTPPYGLTSDWFMSTAHVAGQHKPGGGDTGQFCDIAPTPPSNDNRTHLCYGVRVDCSHTPWDGSDVTVQQCSIPRHGVTTWKSPFGVVPLGAYSDMGIAIADMPQPADGSQATLAQIAQWALMVASGAISAEAYTACHQAQNELALWCRPSDPHGYVTNPTYNLNWAQFDVYPGPLVQKLVNRFPRWF